MRRALAYTAGIIGLAIGTLAGTAVAQTTANGPYYATPSWDQTLPTSTRFIVLSNFASAAVLDRESGLVWQRTPDGTPRDFYTAADSCVVAGTGGKYGWRLPTAPELASLLDTSVPGPVPHVYLPAGHPFQIPMIARPAWTTTAAQEFQNALGVPAWMGVRFFDTIDPPVSPFTTVPKTSGAVAFAWCVRTGA